jgi:hypothetical protein
MTFGTLALEASLAVLVWNRKVRPWVLGAGVLMHVAIATNIMIGFFTMAMLVAYISFTPADRMEGLLLRVLRRPRSFRRSPGQVTMMSSEPAPPAATPPAP